VTAKADAIVVTYYSAEILAECLRGLRADASIDRIVVVNNSPDEETSMEARCVPNTVFVQQPENIGFGRAVNVARGHVVNEFVVLANPDAVQNSSTTREALTFLADQERIGVLGPRMLAGDGSLYRNSQYDLTLFRLLTQSLIEQWKPLRRATDIMRLHRWLGEQRGPAEHRFPHATEYVIGSFMICRRRALDAIGWFDESIFLFGEDQDLCRRVRKAGWEVWYAPVGAVIHSGGHAWRQLSDQGRMYFRQARYRELLRTQGRLPAELYRRSSQFRDRRNASRLDVASGGVRA
jgi:GT2 family glycosyltransferase